MREVLVTAARQRGAGKHGGAGAVTFGDVAHPTRPDAVPALDEVLDRHAAHDPRRGRVAKYRFVFAGLTAPETAEVPGVSVPTAERDWQTARAWSARVRAVDAPEGQA